MKAFAALLLLAPLAAVSQVVYPACPASAPQQCVYLVPPDFMALTVEDGATLGFAIAAVWAVAWGFRALFRLVPSSPRDDAE